MQLTRFAAAVLNGTATPTRHQAPRSGHVPMRMSLPCRSAATPTNQPKWRHKAKPEASRLAGRSVKCSRALRSSAGHICFMDWCRETPDSPATAAMDRTFTIIFVAIHRSKKAHSALCLSAFRCSACLIIVVEFILLRGNLKQPSIALSREAIPTNRRS